MRQFRIHRRIGAAPAKVFAVISDPMLFTRAVPDITEIDFLSEQVSGIGMRFRETRMIKGRKAATELKVIEFENGHLIRLVSEAGGALWDSTFTADPVGDGRTDLYLVMNARPKTILSRLTMPFIGGMVEKALTRDMDAVQTYCEEDETGSGAS